MLFDSPTSLLTFISRTVHPSLRMDKALISARAKAYNFITNYVKACGRRVLAHRQAVCTTCFEAYVFEQAAVTKVASLGPVREVLLLRSHPPAQLGFDNIFEGLYRDARLGSTRPTVLVCHHAGAVYVCVYVQASAWCP